MEICHEMAMASLAALDDFDVNIQGLECCYEFVTTLLNFLAFCEGDGEIEGVKAVVAHRSVDRFFILQWRAGYQQCFRTAKAFRDCSSLYDGNTSTN